MRRRLIAAGALAGGCLLVGVLAAVARRSLSGQEASVVEEVEITFDDGTTYAPDPGSAESRELSAIAAKVLEIGV
jgi:hypothetical protein